MLPTAAAAAAAAVAAAVGVDLVHILAAVAVGIDMAVFSRGGEGGDGHFTPADKLHRMCAQDRRILRPSVDAL
eukprot:COSAG05_NODE_1281_length_5287_cov_51.775636_1_plen_73_part_00